MRGTTTVNVQDRVLQLIEYIKRGHIIEAMHEFYDRDVSMQENANSPTVGLAANIEREKQFLQGVKEWKGFEVTSIAVGDDVSMYEAVFDFIATNGQPVHLEQVDVAKWRDGKIVHERFYYDTAGTKA